LAEFDAATDAFDDGAGYTQAIVVRRFTQTAVRDDIFATTFTPEGDWGLADQVFGYSNLPIRAWMAVAGTPHEVVAFTDAVTEAVADAWAAEYGSVFLDDLGIDVVDPAPAVCDDMLQLFVSVQADPADVRFLSETANTLFGIWRFRAIPITITSLQHGTDSVPVEFGRDFVVAPPAASATGAYEDQVSEVFRYPLDEGSLGSEADFYLDPDPVYIPSLSVWRVYTNNEVELVYFEKAEAEVCLSADDAWFLAPPMAAFPPFPPKPKPERRGAKTDGNDSRPRNRRLSGPVKGA